MKTLIKYFALPVLFGLFVQVASADISGNWVFAVTLGDLGSGDATISLNQEADGKLSGTYSGQLANGPIAGTFEENSFEFSFNSDLLGGDIIYRGDSKEDGTVAGVVVVQDQDIGTFTGKKQ